MAEVCRRSFTSPHSAARVSDHSIRSSIADFDSFSCNLTPNAIFSLTVMGNGVGFWNTMPMRARSAFTSTFGSMILVPSIITWPVARCPGYRSYIRFSTRSRVDLPQPDGPIMPVT